MPTPWHFTTWLDLFDHWQTLAAGILAVLAATGTIWATIRSASREISASQAQTAVAQQQIATTIRLERRRVVREGYAFCAMLEAAMERVLVEAAEAKDLFEDAHSSPQATSSPHAYSARTRFAKSAFSELRAACVRYGGHLTTSFLDLESEIDRYASQIVEGTPSPQSGKGPLLGLHAGFQDQLGRIKLKAAHLRDEAAAEMKQAQAVLAETEALAERLAP
jgi:hypothetical protein